MPPPLMTPEELFTYFDAIGIAHQTYSHPPVFTVAEATALRGSLPGGHCKSLFLKDKKGGFWLAVMLEERRIGPQEAGNVAQSAPFFVWRTSRSSSAFGRTTRKRDAVRPHQ